MVTGHPAVGIPLWKLVGIPLIILGLITGILAHRKNRNFWLWGVLGGIFPFSGLIVLAWASYLCPKCRASLTNQERKDRNCSRCGTF